MENSKAHFDDLYELFYLISYGFNRRCEKEIQEVFYAYDMDTPFLFFEFFMTQPIQKKSKMKKWQKDWVEKVWLTAPFASRMAEHATVVPVIGEKEKAFREAKILQKLKLAFPWKDLKLTKNAWCYWSDREERIPIEGLKINWEEIYDGITGISYPVALVDNWRFDWQEEKFDGTDAAKVLLDLYRPLFIDHVDKDANCLFIPIASSNLFYGGIWVMLPGLKEDNPKKLKGFRKTVGLSVAKLINRCYLPALAIMHEHWMETLVAHRKDANNQQITMPESDYRFRMDGPDGAEYRNPFFQLKELKEKRILRLSSLEVVDGIENSFCRLWEKRYADYSGNPNKKKTRALKDNLIFRKYLVCSELMTQLLFSVVKSANTLFKGNSDSLPACLVVGGAGSGKEKLARMLRLFSRDYQDGQEYVINMASIRPAPLTAAIMVGVELSTAVGPIPIKCKIHGLLQRIRKKADDKPPTIIFDEFNSMDPDSQGVLLRFLDNSEIVALGALDDQKAGETNCLIIGIMNEDPDDISRERAMEFLRSGQYLGNFLGDLLYEHFLSIRRLRPDIMYRMIRNGKFVIPPLRERGEDIPMLFHVFVRDELERLLQREQSSYIISNLPRVHLPLDVLSRLTASDLLWPGNVRQLQALAKVVADCLSAQPAIPPNNYYIVKLPILEKALQQVGLVKNQMFERTALMPTIRK